MTPNRFATQLKCLIEARDQTPVMLVGPPGIGKSSLIYQVAEVFGFGVVDLRLGQVPPADIRGLPTIVE